MAEEFFEVLMVLTEFAFFVFFYKVAVIPFTRHVYLARLSPWPGRQQ